MTITVARMDDSKDATNWLALTEKPLAEIASMELEALFSELRTDPKCGLDDEVAAERLLLAGPNTQTASGKRRPWSIWWHQFQSSVVVLLLLASIASLIYREVLQAIGILLAVIINAITGFYMEYKADVSLSSLKKLSGATARTVRSNKQQELKVKDLVPGDLVILDAGSRIPADLRVIESAGLSVDQAPITGESVPVFKENISSADQIGRAHV